MYRCLRFEHLNNTIISKYDITIICIILLYVCAHRVPIYNLLLHINVFIRGASTFVIDTYYKFTL